MQLLKPTQTGVHFINRLPMLHHTQHQVSSGPIVATHWDHFVQNPVHLVGALRAYRPDEEESAEACRCGHLRFF
jgi:hypothetical protein